MNPDSETCRYWLAEMVGPMAVRLIDGCHSTPEGVAKAAKLHRRIFGVDDATCADGPQWVMVEITAVPDIDVPINEAAADACARMLRGEAPA